MDLVKVGHWAFFLGLLLSIIAGFGGEIPSLTPILIILGLIIGLLNVSEKESTPFLVAVVAFLLVGLAGLETLKFTEWLVPILNNIIAFVAPAGLIVAIKQILMTAKSS